MGIFEQVQGSMKTSNTPGAKPTKGGGVFERVQKNKPYLDKAFENTMADNERKMQREEQQRQQKLLEEQNNALQAFQERKQKVSEGNVFTRAYNSVKDNLGMGETLPEIQGGAQQYQDIRQSQLEDKIVGASPLKNVKNELPGIVKGAWNSAKNAVRPYGEAGLAVLKLANAQYLPKEQQQEATQQGADVLSGGAKMVGEILSDTAKFAVKKINEINPTGNMGLMAQYSNVRKIPVTDPQGNVTEKLLDRNSEEYKQATGAWIDNVGILNYKPEYKNELEKTGGDVTEIGSWFIPITRLGKVAKLEQALASIPKIADLLGVTPKVVKIGGKFLYEVSKDVVDVGVLDAIRGKTDEEIYSDAQAAGIGSVALRAILHAPNAGEKLKQIFAEGKVNKTTTIVEDSIGKLSAGERTAVKELMTEGKPVDDIVESIIAKRADSGADVYTHADDIDAGIVKVGEQKVAEEAKSISTEAKKPISGSAKESPIKTEIKATTVQEIPKIDEIPASKQDIGEKIAPEVRAKQSALLEAPVSKVETPTSISSKSLTGKRIEAAAIEKKLTTEFKDTAEYTPVTIKEQAKQVYSIIDKGDEHINSILSGAERLPSSTRAGSFIVGVERYATKTKNVEMLEKLANSHLMSETSLHAQELRMLAERNPDGVLAMMQALKKVRLEALTKRMKSGVTMEKTMKKATSEIKKARAIHTAPKKTWSDLVEQFKCK